MMEAAAASGAAAEKPWYSDLIGAVISAIADAGTFYLIGTILIIAAGYFGVEAYRIYRTTEQQDRDSKRKWEFKHDEMKRKYRGK